METKYVRSPLMRLSRYGDCELSVISGTGSGRSVQEIEGSLATGYVRWLLTDRPALDRAELAADLGEQLALEHGAAADIVREAVASGVFVPEGTLQAEAARLREWSPMGWRDAADFHIATSQLPFRPDTDDGGLYDEAYAAMLENTSVVGEQPGADYSRGGEYSGAATVPPPDISLDAVLAAHDPINYFEKPNADAQKILSALVDTVGVQKAVDVRLGEHYYKAFPSGGARHPLEVYLVVKDLMGLAPGLYHFHARAKDLELMQAGDFSDEINRACFGKGGILTAGAVVVVTARWKRHNWKYRYAKSYRMVLLEVGHLIQSLSLALAGYGVRGYFCPSINDAKLRDLLGIADDVVESPMYAIGLGEGAQR